MLLTYYTLAHLADEWHASLVGGTVRACYSQARDELAVAIDGPGEDASTLVISLRSGRRLLFRNRGHGRARRNTAELLPATSGHPVERVRTAHRDRMLYLDLGDGTSLQIVLFGPRPNVWLVDGSGMALDAFLSADDWIGRPAPVPRPAPEVKSFEAFVDHWRPTGTIEAALGRAMPLFDRSLAAEAAARAGIDSGADVSSLTESDPQELYEQAATIERELADPSPRIYWRGQHAEAFALIPLNHLEARGLSAESFDRIDDAVRVFSHRMLAQERFDARYRPMVTALRRSLGRLERSLEEARRELASPSRAERYERFGHLLMALAAGESAGRDAIELPDIMGTGEPVVVPLDPALSPLENAQRYYDRARRSRGAREHAEARIRQLETDLEQLHTASRDLDEAKTLDQLDAAIARHEKVLDEFLGSAGPADAPAEPFRRIPLPSGFEAWIGKHGRGNAELTTRHARPHDIWLHARDVPGSHVVIRRESRDAAVPRPVLQRAAELAAHFSSARTSGLVPVQVTERKYVRPLKGAPPGTVRVEREEVLIVEPKAP